GIRVRQRYVPADYNPRTHLSPSTTSPATPDDPARFESPAFDGRGAHELGSDFTELDPRPRPQARRTGLHQRRVRRRRRGIVVLLLVVLLATGAGVGGWWYVAHKPIATPKVINLTQGQAETMITALRLTPEVS